MFLKIILVLSMFLCVECSTPTADNQLIFSQPTMEMKGGRKNDEWHKYFVDENRTIEIVFTTIANLGTTIEWTSDSHAADMDVTTIRSEQEANQTELINSTMKVQAKRGIEWVACLVDHPTFEQPFKYEFHFYVLHPIPVTISMITDGKGQHNAHVREGQEFMLRCVGGGMEGFTLRWLEDSRLPVGLREFYPVDTKSLPGIIPFVEARLNVTAERHMRSFGCEAVSPLLETPLISWFNVTVTYPPNVTLEVSEGAVDIYGGVGFTFYCLTKAVYPEKVTYEWILNDNTSLSGGSNITIDLSKMEWQNISCLATDEYGSASSFMDISEFMVDFYSQIFVPWSLAIVVGIVVTFILGFIAFIIEYLLTRQQEETFKLADRKKPNNFINLYGDYRHQQYEGDSLQNEVV